MSVKCPYGPVTRAPWGLLPRFHRDPLGLLEDVGNRYPGFASLPFGPWTLYLATEDTAVEDVLRPHKDHFRKGPGMEAQNPLIGRGLLLSEGDLWREQRKAIAPVFHPDSMKAYRIAIAERIGAAVSRFFTPGQLDAGEFGRYLALIVTMDVFFGVASAAESVRRVDKATAQVMEHFHHRARSAYRPPYHWPKVFNRAFHQASGVLTDFIEPLFDEPSTPLLKVLANSPVERRAEEALTFLIAGHETTGNALAWTLRLLAEYPDIADRVGDEALHQGDPFQPGAYTQAVCLEALRLFPPVWLISRTATHEVEVQGYALPAGSDFLVSPWVTHRRSGYYSEPTTFRPERWIRSREVVRSRTDYRFLAFGGGPRRCPGEEFALTEMMLAISFICREWNLRPLTTALPSPHPGMTLAPHGALGLVVTRR